MLQNEFEERIGQAVTWEEYQIVDTVYSWYPEDMSKDQMAELWKIGGMRLIKDLYPTAARMMDLDTRIRKYQKERTEALRQAKEADAMITHLIECKRAMVAGENRIYNEIMHEALGELDVLADADALPDDGVEGL
jgi:hypothetical protein